MQSTIKLSFFTLMLMISFASVNAVLFTPALPNIAAFFDISNQQAQYTITWFLIGYAFGQLLYGPLANRYGRKSALYIGVIGQIISCMLCVLSGYIHSYLLLVVGRLFLALGSGVGLKMTFTLVNECYEPKIASQKISYLMLAFAITPGLSIALGGFLNQHYGWISCFYASAVYGIGLLCLITRLPETKKTVDLNALKISHLVHEYGVQFKDWKLMLGGFLMGCCTAFIYLFSAVAPFVAINILGMDSQQYGNASLIPALGLVLGSVSSANLVKKYSLRTIIKLGLSIIAAGVICMCFTTLLHQSALLSLFYPMMIIYLGLSFIFANASTVAMSHVSDKAHGSAVMSFINMGMATLVVLMTGIFPLNVLVLPALYITLTVLMIILFGFIK